MLHIALYMPDIAQNVGSHIRLAACLGVPLHIIEPCGFAFDMRRIKQTAMDYTNHVDLRRHASWEAFLQYRQAQLPQSRLCLLTTKGSTLHHKVIYQEDDILLLGRESAGVPDEVHESVDMRVRIPMAGNVRSLNITTATTIVLSEALRQTGGWADI